MRVFVVVLLVLGAVSAARNTNTKAYKKAIKNEKKLRKLFAAKFGDKDYSDDETDTRLPYFKEALEFVVQQNTDPAIAWESDINFLADSTPEEREKLLMKVYESETEYTFPEHELGDNGIESIDWEAAGYVRPVSDQTEDCRACWAFAAVVAIEGRYQVITNSSVDFSEQELVDCVYYIRGRDQDGCYGGNLNDVYDYVIDYGRLATEDALAYEHVDHGSCDYDDIKNGLEDAHIDSWELITHTDQAHIDALVDGPISAAIQTTESFLFYKSGVFKDESCSTLIPNHAVALVGYNQDSFKVKNSWGTQWGDAGYMEIARGHHGCGLMYYTIVPQFSAGAPATVPLPGPPDECRDEWGADFCGNYLAYCVYYEKWCTLSCGAC